MRNAPIDSLNLIQIARATGIGKPIFAINGANPIDEKDFPAWRADQYQPIFCTPKVRVSKSPTPRKISNPKSFCFLIGSQSEV
jgi:hypothetical protein